MTLFWISWKGGQECGHAVTQSSNEDDTWSITYLMGAVGSLDAVSAWRWTHSRDIYRRVAKEEVAFQIRHHTKNGRGKAATLSAKALLIAVCRVSSPLFTTGYPCGISW